jgi:transcriptional regulator with XRE-family HTH domain
MHQTLSQQQALRTPQLAPQATNSANADGLTREQVASLLDQHIRTHFKTQTEAAKHWGVSQQFVAKVRRGKKNPTNEMLVALGLGEKDKFYRVDDPNRAKDKIVIALFALEQLRSAGADVKNCDFSNMQPVITIEFAADLCASLHGHAVWTHSEPDDFGNSHLVTGFIAVYHGCLVRWVKTDSKGAAA